MATAVEQVQQLDAELHVLRDSRDKLCSEAKALIASSLNPNAPPSAFPNHAPISQLITELSELSNLQSLALGLKRLTDATRDVEKVLRSTTGLGEQDFDTYTSRLLEGIQAFGNASVVQAETHSLVSTSSDETVNQLHSSLETRLQVARTALSEGITSQIQSLLGECGWPPPLSTAGAVDLQPDTGSGQQAGSGRPSMEGGKPFPPSCTEAVQKLRKLLVVLTALQLQEQKKAGGQQAPEDPTPTPILWFATQLAQPLGERLAAQFSPSLPTGRLDKPEWLLNTALRITRDYAPRLEELFKGAVEAARLPMKCRLALEFPRAMREAVKHLMATQRLPEVLLQDGPAQQQLWPLHVDALLQFEAKLAPLLGLTVADPEELPLVVLKGGCMELFCEHYEFLDAWSAAENAAQQPTVDAALYSEEGWQPASSLVGGEEEDVPAWQREFYPTAGAESVVSLVEDCLARARCIPSAEAQWRFIDSIAGDVLKVAEGRMLRILQQADTFKDPLGPHWAPKIASCICAAHYLQHHLTEIATSPLAVQLLVLHPPELPPQDTSKEPATPGYSLAYTSEPPSATRADAFARFMGRHEGGPSYSVSSVGGGGSVVSPMSSRGGTLDFTTSPTSRGGGRGETSTSGGGMTLLGRQAASMGALRYKRSLKLSKLVRGVFRERSRAYCRGKHSFGAVPLSAEELPPSPSLVSGLEQLRDLLLRLSLLLDGKTFRELWRSVASSASRTLFNEIATEATFSPGGVQQFAADCAATISLFAPFTAKPAAHFRELCDALRLLQLDEPATSQLLQRLQQSRNTEAHQQILVEAGSSNLTPVQAFHLLSHKTFTV